MLQTGNKPVDTMYVGGKLVQQAYLGGKKIYPEHGVIPKAIKDSMVLWYDLKRQGATNESMAADPTIRDLSGNGHDATCYNFAWSGMSGIGGYEIRPNNDGQFTGTIQWKSQQTKCVITSTGTYGKIWQIVVHPGDTSPSYKIEVTGVTNSGFVLTTADMQENFQISEDGEYLIPAHTNNAEKSEYPGISFIENYENAPCNITIELLPLYPHTLVSDGVDDYAMVEGLPLLTKEKGYTVVAKRKNLYQLNEKGIVASKHNGSNGGAFQIEYNFNNVDAYAANFGAFNTIQISSSEIIYQTSKSYNDETSLNIGTRDDTSILDLFKYIKQYFGKVALYSFLLFDRDLTVDEINWVKTNLIESEQ